MNRKKKINQTLKNKLKKANAKLQKSNKPKYISKAVREQMAIEAIENSKILETQRLSLGTLVSSDAKMIFTLFNEPNVLEYIGDKEIRTLDDAERYIVEDQQTKQKTHGFSFYCMRIKDTNTPIGICGLIQRDGAEFVELGFAVLSEYYRQGYTREASEAVIDFAKTTLNLDTLYAKSSQDNLPSKLMLEQLGFTSYSASTLDKDLSHFILSLT